MVLLSRRKSKKSSLLSRDLAKIFFFYLGSHPVNNLTYTMLASAVAKEAFNRLHQHHQQLNEAHGLLQILNIGPH